MADPHAPGIANIPNLENLKNEVLWRQWAMEHALTLLAADRIESAALEKTAERIFRWTAYQGKIVDG